MKGLCKNPVQANPTEIMTKLCRVLSFALLFLSWVAAGVLGTETQLTLFWPSAFGIGLAGGLALLSGPWKLQAQPSQWAMFGTMLCVIYLLLRCFLSPVEEYAREDLVIVASGAVIYLLMATVFSHRSYRLWWLGGLALVLIGNVWVGKIQYDGRWDFHILPGYVRSFGEGQRIGGFFNNSNHLGTLLVMVGAIITSVAFFLKTQMLWRLLSLMLSLLALVALALTVSRGAFLAAIGAGVAWVIAVLYLWRKTEPEHFGKTVFLGLGLTLIFGIFLLQPFLQQIQQRLETSGMEQFVEGDPRTEIWKAAINQWRTQPFLGVGSRMFYDGCIEYRTITTPQIGEALFVHNDWLQLLTEYGLLGVVLVFLVLAGHLIYGMKYFRWFGNERYLRIGSIQGTHLALTLGAWAALIAISIHAWVEFPLHVPYLALIAASALGILANPGRIAARVSPPKIPGMRWMVRSMMVALSALLIHQAWAHAKSDWLYDKAVQIDASDKSLHLKKMLLLNQVLDKDPGHSAALHARAQLRYKMGSEMPPEIAKSFLLKAEVDAKKATELNPRHFYYYLTLGDILDAQGAHDGAYQAYDMAFKLAPLYEAPRVAFAQHFQRQGKWVEAEYCYLWARDANAVGGFIWSPHYQALLNYLGRQIDAQLALPATERR